MKLNDRLNKEKAKISQMKDLPEYAEEIKRKKQLGKKSGKRFENSNTRKKRARKKRQKILLIKIKSMPCLRPALRKR